MSNPENDKMNSSEEDVDFTEQDTVEQVPEDSAEEVEEEIEIEDEEQDAGDTEEEAVDMVDQLSKQLAESQDKVLRLRAELDNLRKRNSRDINDARQNSKISTIEEILPVMDQFQMAVMAMESNSDLETIKQGMSMILNTFNSCFDNLGIKKLSSMGQVFDPNQHEAVSAEYSDEYETDIIIREWKSGYKLGERLLRPSTVVVSKGPEPVAEEEEIEVEFLDENATEEGNET